MTLSRYRKDSHLFIMISMMMFLPTTLKRKFTNLIQKTLREFSHLFLN